MQQQRVRTENTTVPTSQGNLEGMKKMLWHNEKWTSHPHCLPLLGSSRLRLRLVLGTSTTDHLCFCLLQKTYSTEPRSSAPRSTHIFFGQTHTARLICAIVICSLAWPSEMQCSPGQLIPWSPNGPKTFRDYAHNRQGWWKLFHLWGTKVEKTLSIPHRKPVARMGTEYRSSKLQSGILSRSCFLPEYSLCVSALKMSF